MEELKNLYKDKRIKQLEQEKQELEKVILNMAKCMFQRDNVLMETIKDINKNLRIIARRK